MVVAYLGTSTLEVVSMAQGTEQSATPRTAMLSDTRAGVDGASVLIRSYGAVVSFVFWRLREVSSDGKGVAGSTPVGSSQLFHRPSYIKIYSIISSLLAVEASIDHGQPEQNYKLH
jgi:hypothetical protein